MSKRPRGPQQPAALSIGVDLGGTHVLAVLMDASGHVYGRHGKGIAGCTRESQDAVGGALRECIRAIHDYAIEHHPNCLPLRGVGIAVPGNVDPKLGHARYLPNFGWLTAVDLGELILDRTTVTGDRKLRDLLRVDRVHMRNDGRCAALAERHFGAGAGGEHSVMAMLTLGTGIGGALIHDPTPEHRGAIFDGCTFDAGDFGHHVMRSGRDAFACVCGNHGCFECHASAAGLVRHWRSAGGDEAAISLDDAKSVVERMRDGECVARTAFAAYRADLATGLANLVTFYNPSLIVLGGGLSRTS
jgi:glucokinase